MSGSEPSQHPRFLITDGGPFHRLEARLGLTRADPAGIARRWIRCALLTWVPLLVLSALQRNAIGHQVAMSFLGDFAAHARFLVAVPLILAAAVLGPWLADAANQFASRSRSF
jgi:hypothetical protein